MDQTPQAEGIFPLGCRVSCTTAFEESIEGEVLAFDRPHSLLALKTLASAGGSGGGELMFVNINMVKQIQQTKPAPEDYRPVQTAEYNEAKIRDRHAKSKAEKRRTMIHTEGVTPEGEAMFKYLSRTFEPKDVQWTESTILVFGYVAVRPPYAVDDVRLRHNYEVDPPHYIDGMKYVKTQIVKYGQQQSSSQPPRSRTATESPVEADEASGKSSASSKTNTPTHLPAKKRNSNASNASSTQPHNNSAGKHH